MEIEIVTTKKKLTKSLINQMKSASVNALQHGEVLGYMVDIVKGSYKAVLIGHMDEYFTISTVWNKRELSVFRKIGKWSQVRKFDDEIECDKWWAAYQSVLDRATVQIYI